ncbi:X-ray repair cross-complementing protein 6 [Hyla sarda]|uniref:X-ray repair cross-complementing protein 6 n=1 Tax=Hyla sarda TaxID=327740 RepID=UPI0024C3ED0D|nr:X-ray repair cross-complementing protein 6 [Hyla sarda]XP_056379817.1 X-ray repair cross-complementing protein 6 [Hyla sarda]XP_056379818.1 X-ray repair cross-complementing protein 6 [Hyla sarda]
MADWSNYYDKEEGNEDEEHEDGEGEPGEFRFGGRDCLIFLVDASKQMFKSPSDDDLTPFDIALQCIKSVYTSKIISSNRDLLALVFFGTKESKSPASFKHIFVLHDLDSPGAKRVLDLDKYREEKGRAYFSETIGHSSNFSLADALWCCSNLFSNIKMKISHKRIMLFTNEDNPHSNESDKITQAVTKAKDLRGLGACLDLMHLEKEGGFDISKFYRDIVNNDEDEDLGVQYKASRKLDDLMRKVRAKENKKRSMCRIPLKLSDDLYLTVGVYNLIQKAFKPPPVKLYRETNEPVKTKTRTFNRETGSLLLPSDTKKAQTYGNRQIVLEKEETEELKRFDDPSLVLVGFKPISLLKTHHFIRPAQFVYPEESLVSGSSTLFNALLMKCLERQVMAVCRYTPRRNTPPRFVALVPQEEKLDEENLQVKPPGFNLIFMPYADDIRKIDYPEVVPANEEQVDKMKEIVHKLRFKYRSESFENPALQQHFRNLEALALDLMEPEPIEDLTLPKTDMIDNRLGSLAEEFKELVFPPGYNPEGKAVKRKQGGGDSQAVKKAKTETSISEAELRAHVKNGTLGKLTVPVLKESCRTFGLKGGKKQELMDALVNYFHTK